MIIDCVYEFFSFYILMLTISFHLNLFVNIFILKIKIIYKYKVNV